MQRASKSPAYRARPWAPGLGAGCLAVSGLSPARREGPASSLLVLQMREPWCLSEQFQSKSKVLVLSLVKGWGADDTLSSSSRQRTAGPLGLPQPPLTLLSCVRLPAGGENIKSINQQSGAHVELQRNPPPNTDPNLRIFTIRGIPQQIEVARHLIDEKVGVRTRSFPCLA